MDWIIPWGICAALFVLAGFEYSASVKRRDQERKEHTDEIARLEKLLK